MRQVRPSSASTTAASDQANCSPMHIRGPAPKGRYAPRGWPGSLGVEAICLSRYATQPAVRPELIGLCPPPRVAMQQRRADQAHRPRRNRAPTEHHRLEHPTAEHPGRRPEPQRLGEDGHRQRKIDLVGGPLRFEVGAYRRRLVDRGDRPRQRHGRRLVPGQQQGHHLVPHLPISELRRQPPAGPTPVQTGIGLPSARVPGRRRRSRARLLAERTRTATGSRERSSRRPPGAMASRKPASRSVSAPVIRGVGPRRSAPNSAVPAPSSVIADISATRSISPPSVHRSAARRAASAKEAW